MKLKSAVFSVLFLFLGTLPLYSQGNTAVLYEGTMLRGSFRPLTDDAGLSGMSATQSIFPGVEVRFNQNGRVTIGAGFQRWMLEAPQETYSVINHPQTGQGMALVNLNSSAKANMLGGTVYLNLLTSGRFRPFVAVGGGVAFIKEDYSTTTWVDPNFRTVWGYQFRFEKPEDAHSVSRIKPAAKGLVGVNIFPIRPLLVSLGGGYNNGVAVNFSFGFVF